MGQRWTKNKGALLFPSSGWLHEQLTNRPPCSPHLSGRTQRFGQEYAAPLYLLCCHENNYYYYCVWSGKGLSPSLKDAPASASLWLLGSAQQKNTTLKNRKLAKSQNMHVTDHCSTWFICFISNTFIHGQGWSNHIRSLNPGFYSAGALFLFLPATWPQNWMFFFSTEKCPRFSWIIFQTFNVRFIFVHVFLKLLFSCSGSTRRCKKICFVFDKLKRSTMGEL